MRYIFVALMHTLLALFGMAGAVWSVESAQPVDTSSRRYPVTGLVTDDSTGIQSLRYVNRAWCEALGYAHRRGVIRKGGRISQRIAGRPAFLVAARAARRHPGSGNGVCQLAGRANRLNRFQC